MVNIDKNNSLREILRKMNTETKSKNRSEIESKLANYNKKRSTANHSTYVSITFGCFFFCLAGLEGELVSFDVEGTSIAEDSSPNNDETGALNNRKSDLKTNSIYSNHI